MSDGSTRPSATAKVLRFVVIGLAGATALALVGAGLFFVAVQTGIYTPYKPYRQPEAKANLKAAFTSQKSFFQEKDRYSTNAVKLGFSPERGNRYAYFLAPSGPQDFREKPSPPAMTDIQIIGADRAKFPTAPKFLGFRSTGCPLALTAEDGFPLQLGVVEKDGRQEFVVAAAGNVDDDPDLDCWSISSTNRIGPSGEKIPAEMPWVERSDI